MELWVKGGGERITFHKHNEAVKAEKNYIKGMSQKKVALRFHVQESKIINIGR